MKNPDPDLDHDNPDHDQRGVVVPASGGGALTSLQALKTALGGVDMSSIAGRSGLPMLQFKREGSGTWMYGQKKTVVEDGSLWGVNPATFRWGYVSFSNEKVVGERLGPINQPKPEVTGLPDTGFEWHEEMTVHMKCIGGTDAGIEVVFKMSTDGGVKAIAGLVDAVLNRLNGGEHGDKVVPIVRLEKDSYSHIKHGRVWYPVLTIVDWMPLSGPAPASSPPPASPPPPEQPRRRRVA